jgi:hypothetical protein
MSSAPNTNTPAAGKAKQVVAAAGGGGVGGGGSAAALALLQTHKPNTQHTTHTNTCCKGQSESEFPGCIFFRWYRYRSGF